MTTIASTSATTSYRYTKLASATTESQSISSNVTAAASSGGVSSTASDDSALIDSAQKLLSQLMSMLMSMQQGQTTSGGDQSGADTARDDLVTSMDTDGDGQVSMAEFVAARPSDVGEDQATNLFNSFDTEGSGSLTADQLQEAMSTNAPLMGAGSPPASSTSSDHTLSDLFSSLDTDGDGVISQEEFAAGRPDDVSEEQATLLFESLDTDGAGSITKDQFVDAMKPQLPPSADFRYPDFESEEAQVQAFVI